MPEYINFQYGGNNKAIVAPNKCPLCHHTVVIKELIAYLSNGDLLQFVFKCPNNDCNSYFIAYYKKDSTNNFTLMGFKPINIVIPNFADIVKQISPMFLSVYREAEEARQIGLSQIAGAGFRKSFEFLIKDYAKNNSTPEKHPEIETSFAGNVVNNFIPDARIQSVAKRALWIGNDETHYLRKWEEKDINDLITLINLTIHWIEIEHLSSEYSKEMPE